MTFNEYQEFTREGRVYPTLGHPVVYPVLALAGEAGEVANEVKKAMRDESQRLTATRKEAIAFELGDTLWYIAAVADELGYNLSMIADMNKEKLLMRRSVGQGRG